MILRIILIIIVALILSYGAWAYIDKIVTAQHDEMMKTYVHRCNGGLTDEEVKEIQREDE
jgi:capsular polysaccharide biosynthesis protein